MVIFRSKAAKTNAILRVIPKIWALTPFIDVVNVDVPASIAATWPPTRIIVTFSNLFLPDSVLSITLSLPLL